MLKIDPCCFGFSWNYQMPLLWFPEMSMKVLCHNVILKITKEIFVCLFLKGRGYIIIHFLLRQLNDICVKGWRSMTNSNPLFKVIKNLFLIVNSRHKLLHFVITVYYVFHNHFEYTTSLHSAKFTHVYISYFFSKKKGKMNEKCTAWLVTYFMRRSYWQCIA